MIDAIRAVRDQACRVLEDKGQCGLRTITNIVVAHTQIDRVEFVGYDADPENPIWGQFLRWEISKAYAQPETFVEIRYANHMDRAWRRFVVAKEMCHALDARRGSHSVSDDAVTDLINDLALMSTDRHALSTAAPVRAEKMAEAGAVEIIIPLKLRKELLSSGELTRMGYRGMAEKYGLPEGYTRMAFDVEYIGIAETIF